MPSTPYVIQTELTQAVQRTYQKPYFLLFLTHSAYIFIFPIHLLILKLTQPSIPFNKRINQIKLLIIQQFNHRARANTHHPTRSTPSHTISSPSPISPDLAPLLNHANDSSLDYYQPFPLCWFIKISIQLTLFIATPSLCWYAAVPFADMTSITSIFNTNACFTYIFAVWFLESESFQTRKTIGVIISLIGSIMISYSQDQPEPPSSDPTYPIRSHNLRILGIALAFLGSIGFALYEVWYKKVIALVDVHAPRPISKNIESNPLPKPSVTPPFEAFLLSSSYDHDHDHDVDRIGLESRTSNLAIEERGQESVDLRSEPRAMSDEYSMATTFSNGMKSIEEERRWRTSLDGLLYSNLMTSMIGLVTILLLWIPIPILNRLEIEKFELMNNPYLLFMIIGIMVTGVIFNAGFMILIAFWGPVIASVGNLCTLVLIAIVDHTSLGSINDRNSGKVPTKVYQFDTITLLGCIFVLCGFFVITF